GTFLIVFAYSVYSAYTKPFIYAAGTRMFIEKGPVKAAAFGIVDINDDHSIANQIQFFRSNVVAAHVARLMHEYAEGNRQELDSLYTQYFKTTNAIPPDPRQIALIRIVDNPKQKNIPGIADVGTIAVRVSSAVSILPDVGNDYLNVAAEAY